MGTKVVIAIILEIELQGVPKLVADKLLFPPHSLLNDPVEFLLHSVQILFDKIDIISRHTLYSEWLEPIRDDRHDTN